ncbi:DUF736 family protein [Ensifer sp. SL37]|uniref:DUF736 family protein n=1 Tax=Ensifer sp. SL37 TaxID=2995137 RepID=UPI0022748919|nr:DUF736 family protein [Ensifer sp. SL37]MCY1745064.1 DUF736 family protein [Ensifer sp. SL37]
MTSAHTTPSGPFPTLNVKTKFVPSEAKVSAAPTSAASQAPTSSSAWKTAARETQREYLSVKLDDPSFPAPI